MLNFLKYAKRLEESGINRKQAEVEVEVMAEMMFENFSTKQELKDLEIKMEQGFREIQRDLILAQSRKWHFRLKKSLI